jgi:hypothetical protein
VPGFKESYAKKNKTAIKRKWTKGSVSSFFIMVFVQVYVWRFYS